MSIEAGQQLLHYRLIEKIGEGGMGVVWEATDIRLDRKVAVKILPPKLTRDSERSARFQQEARLAAAFNHPNIATVHDVGEQDGVTFIVMELMQGESLRSLVRDEPLDVDRAIDIAIGIAAGLARAHREGVLHRDLKPDNVMLTDDGVPKILDFGLGKLIDKADPPGLVATEMPTVTALNSQYVTRAGEVIGTLAYMSPEQVQGRPVDARTDVFAFGVLLYEMLAGKRPFAGESALDTATAILRDEPATLDGLGRDLPSELETILARSLAKEPEDRFASGEELHEALLSLKRRIDAPAAGLGTLMRRPGVLAVTALLAILIAAGVTWMIHRNSRRSWARNEALPEIERLYDSGDRDAAMRLLYEASEIVPEDPRLIEYFSSITIAPLSFDTDPPGATVHIKGYNHPERDWIHLGETPIEDFPVDLPARFRIEKAGYVPFEGSPIGIHFTIRLFRDDEIPPGMVYVPAGTAGFGASEPVELEDFWIDKYEVTNLQYKAFVDDGGYRDDRFWPQELDRSSFVDTTGRPGPIGWELGSYPEGKENLPVGGVSWFEASAYAAWAGKSLPTVFHWRLAAQQGIFSEILLWSNFDTKGPAEVGSYDGLGPNGTYDMAGNVREWCINRIGDSRHSLGGAWSDPDYLYRSTDAADPDNRSEINGFRCMQTSEPPPNAALVAIEHTTEDHRQDSAIGDDLFSVVRREFDYDDRELDPQIESTDESPEYWRHEVVSVRTAYGDERLPIHLFLPKNAEPPFQAVVYFPPSSALYLTDSRRPSFPFGHFIPKSGRALVYPIFQGTYERQVDRHGPNDYRDHRIQMGKDLQRTIDFLETREDIDSERLAYYGLSWGAFEGPLMTAVEPRFNTSVLLAGGLRTYSEDWPPASIPQNFAPRSTVPTLMINGRNDFGAPIDTNIQPLFDMLGTPDEHKRLVVLDGGHVPASTNEVIREVLDWLDLYLGPVDADS